MCGRRRQKQRFPIVEIFDLGADLSELRLQTREQKSVELEVDIGVGVKVMERGDRK
jgi:hypothetical protein